MRQPVRFSESLRMTLPWAVGRVEYPGSTLDTGREVGGGREECQVLPQY